MATAQELVKLAAILAQIAQTLADDETDPPAPLMRAMPERALLTVEEVARYLGVGRTLMYQLIKDQEIETVQIHRLRRVPREAVDAYAARIQNEQSAA
jgi:excisionase family DNA binding protein